VSLASRADAIDFVGQKLAALPIYKPATYDYRRARADGADVHTKLGCSHRPTLQLEASAIHSDRHPRP
jgi:hypothetical protein